MGGLDDGGLYGLARLVEGSLGEPDGLTAFMEELDEVCAVCDGAFYIRLGIFFSLDVRPLLKVASLDSRERPSAPVIVNQNKG